MKPSYLSCPHVDFIYGATPIASLTRDLTPLPPLLPQAEAAEAMDHFELEITVTNPEKSGDGIGAYIAYTVNTRTSMPSFKNSQSSVRRRYSDFLALYQKLEDTYSHLGRIVPAPPEKSVVGECVGVHMVGGVGAGRE